MRYEDTRGKDTFVGTSADDVFLIRRGGPDKVDGGDGFDRLKVDYSAIDGTGSAGGTIYLNSDATLSGQLDGPDTGGRENGVRFWNIEKIDYTGASGDDFLSVVVARDYRDSTLTVDLGDGFNFLQITYYETLGGQSIELLADGTLRSAMGTFFGVDRLSLSLTDHDDTAIAGAANDVLDGRGGDDHLNGGAGDDFLSGQFGTDVLTGGLGADNFTFDNPRYSGGKNVDTITDFSHAEGDRIFLSAIDADRNQRGNQAFVFIDQAQFTGPGGHDGEVRQQINGDGTITLEADRNHDGKADVSILIHSDAPLVVADIVL